MRWHQHFVLQYNNHHYTCFPVSIELKAKQGISKSHVKEQINKMQQLQRPNKQDCQPIAQYWQQISLGSETDQRQWDVEICNPIIFQLIWYRWRFPTWVTHEKKSNSMFIELTVRTHLEIFYWILRTLIKAVKSEKSSVKIFKGLSSSQDLLS